MKNKLMKYVLMIIAALLLVATAFAGAGSAADFIINTEEDLKKFFSTGVGTGVLAKDFTGSYSVGPASGLVLDLGGHKLATNGKLTIKSGVALEITNLVQVRGTVGQIKLDGTGAAVAVGTGVTVIGNCPVEIKHSGASFTLQSGSEITKSGSVKMSAGSFIMESGSEISSSDSIKISGGTFTMKDGSKITKCDQIIIDGDSAKFEMKGGEISECKGSKGGAVYLKNGGTFTMDSGIIKDSQSDGDGGAVYLDGGYSVFTMNGGKIDNCYAKGKGGAVYLNDKATFTLSGGTIQYCHSNNDGGCVYLDDDNTVFTMVGSTILGCYGGKDGGSVYVDDKATFSMTDSTIQNSKTPYDGGAVYLNNHATVTMTNIVIDTTESGRSGGAIYLDDDNTICTIYGGTIKNSSSSSHGGAIFLDDKGRITLNNVNIINSQSKDNGGTIYIDDSAWAEMNGGSISNSHCGNDGGAVYINSGSGSFSLLDGVITRSVSDHDGGAIYLNNGNHDRSACNLQSSSITESHAYHDGGAIYLDDDSWGEAYGSTISNCWAAGIGGAVFGGNTAKFDIYSGTITDCHAVDGGAFYFNYKSSLTMNECTIKDSYCDNEGGGIFLDGMAELYLSDTSITNCRAGNNGGGICFSNTGTHTLYGVTISDSHASNNGGGIYNKGFANLTLKSSAAKPWKITNCSAGLDGGGIFIYDLGIVTLIGGEISDCHADGHLTPHPYSSNLTIMEGGNGGAIFDGHEVTVLDGCVIKNSYAGSAGGGIYVPTVFSNGPDDFRSPVGPSLILSNNVRIENCHVTDSNIYSSGTGGGIYTGFDTVIEKMCVIDGCTARCGGGIFLMDSANLTMRDNCKISNCRAESRFSDPPSVPQGGAIYASGGETMYVWEDLTAAIKIDAKITDTTFSNNHGYLTGGVSFTPVNGGTLTMDECKFTDNTADTDFGALSVGSFAWWSREVKYTISRTTFTGNKASGEGGAAGVFMTGASSTGGTFSECVFAENQARNGGALYVENVYNVEEHFDSSKKKNVPEVYYDQIKKIAAGPYSPVPTTGDYKYELKSQKLQTLTLTGCQFSGNKASVDGGAIFMQESYENDECRKNMASHTIKICEDTRINLNTAAQTGGAYKLNTSDNFNAEKYFKVKITDSRLQQNHADYYAVLTAPVLPAIGGRMTVDGNTNGVNMANNFVIPPYELLTLEKALSPSSNIGITTAIKPTAENPVTFLKDVTDSGPYFFSDSSDYAVDTKYVSGTSAPYNIQLVVNGGTPVASVTHLGVVTNYYLLSNAINAARDGDLITLLRDVNENAVFDKTSGSYTFDLAGHTLLAQTESNPTVTVKQGTTVTIRDTGGNARISGSANSGISVEYGAAVTLESGTVSGNSAKFGGGIRNAGTLNVIGGAITANTADISGGGIFDVGSLTITGGRVTNNIAPKAGGIYYGSAPYPHDTTSFTLGGSPQIAKNINAGTTVNASNIYLTDPQKFRITCTVGLNPTEKIGVSTAKVPPQYVTNGAATDFNASFASDDTRYLIKDEVSGDHYVLIYDPTPVSRDNWTVSFDTLGVGESPVSQMVENNTNATRPSPDPAEPGYRFNDWVTSSDGTGSAYDFTAPVTEDLVLYANWTKRWLVSFEMQNVGTVPAGYPTQVDNGTLISEPAPAPTADGYTFNGWYYEPACTNAVSFPVTITRDTYIYANWTPIYTVRFETSGIGTPIASQSVADGGMATRPSPDPSGLPEYVFDDWYASPSFAPADVFNFSAPITGNTIVYANWIPVTFTVDFDTNGSTSMVPNQTVYYGGLVREPANVTKEGSLLKGWYNGSTQWNFAADTVDTNLTLTAFWQEYDCDYPITIDNEENCKIYAPASGMSGTTINITIRASTGAKLAGLSVNKTNSTPVVPVTITRDTHDLVWNASFTMPHDAVYLSAHADELSFEVIYEPNGGTVSPENETVRYGDTAGEPSASRDGYALVGWKNGTADWNFATDKVYSNLTLNASWSKQIVYTWYNVILTPDENSTLYSSASIAKETDPVQLSVRSQDGYVVTGLLINGTAPAGITKSADNRVWNVTVSMPNHDINVTSTTAENTHTVTFDANGGTPTPASQTVHDGGYVSEPQSVTQAGYVLTGWKNGTVDWNFATDKVYGDITLTANWSVQGADTWYKVNTATIANGTVIASTKQAKAGDIVIIGIRAVSGYKVTGLTVETATHGVVTVNNLSKTAGDLIWTGNFTMPAEDVTVSGTTAEQKYTVTFNATGGTAIPENATVAYGEYVSEPYAEKTNAVLVGWKNGTADWNFASDKVYSDIELKANWTEYSPDPWYAIELLPAGNATLHSSLTTANATTPVNITAVANTGAVITDLKITGITSGTAVTPASLVKSPDDTLWEAVFSMPAEDVNVSCSAELRSCTVTFNATGGNVIPENTTVVYGGYVDRPSVAEKAGAVLEGWYNGSAKWNFASDKVYRDIELKANWTVSSIFYNITAEPVYGGTIYAQEKVAKSGDTVHVSFISYDDFELSTFAVRYLNGTDILTPAVSGTSYTGTFTMPDADVVLNGTTNQVNFTVTARILSGSGYGEFTVDKDKAGTGETVNFTAKPYAGYIVENNSITINDIPKTLISIGGYAGYATDTVNGKDVLGTVSFERGMFTITVVEDSLGRIVTNKSSAAPNETVRIVSVPGIGRNVSMFYVTNLATGAVTNLTPIHSPLDLIFATNFTMPKADVLVSAEYEEKVIPGAYAITKDSTGSGKVLVSSQGLPNATKMVLAIPGNGYWTDSVSVKMTGGSSTSVPVVNSVNNIYGFIMPSSDVHVSVRFATNPPADTSSGSGRHSGATVFLSTEMCEVKFIMNGHGNQVTNQSVSLGATADEPVPAPTAEGYIFTGWYADPGLSSRYVFSTPVTDNIYLYAGWVATDQSSTIVQTPAPTQKSPAPVAGLIAGLGIAALFLRLRK